MSQKPARKTDVLNLPSLEVDHAHEAEHRQRMETENQVRQVALGWQSGLDEFRTSVLQMSEWETAEIKAVLRLIENTLR